MLGRRDELAPKYKERLFKFIEENARRPSLIRDEYLEKYDSQGLNNRSSRLNSTIIGGITQDDRSKLKSKSSMNNYRSKVKYQSFNEVFLEKI